MFIFHILGINQCSNRYAKANNKYMSDFNEQATSNYTMYFDVNNLYGFAMQKQLPTGGFRWLQEDELLGLDLDDMNENSSKDYILEIDLEYTKELQDNHKVTILSRKYYTSPT